MSHRVSDDGKKHQDRRRWCLALLGLAAASTAYVTLSGAEKRSYDASNISGCVSQNQWKITSDIPHSRLRYQSFMRGETDDKDLHEQFLARVMDKTHSNGNHVAVKDLHITFTVYYKFDRRVYKQFASAMICRRPFGSSENECRNRSYFFFSHIDPITLADVLIEDIASYEPIIRKCMWDK